jgi:hypothetical protein
MLCELDKLIKNILFVGNPFPSFCDPNAWADFLHIKIKGKAIPVRGREGP